MLERQGTLTNGEKEYLNMDRISQLLDATYLGHKSYNYAQQEFWDLQKTQLIWR